MAGEYIDARTVPGVPSVPGFPVPRPSRAFYWAKGVVTELPTLGGIIGAAKSINDKSELVGNVATGADQTTVTASFCGTKRRMENSPCKIWGHLVGCKALP